MFTFENFPMVIVIALVNAFFAGFHGSAAVVSTAISSRAMAPRTALRWSAPSSE